MSAPITLVGRIGAEPDVKFATSGSTVVRLRVVTSARRQVDGQWQDSDVTWWTVVAFGKVADSAAESLSKGDPVIVVGKVRGTEWEVDGQRRNGMEVVASSIGPDLRMCAAKVIRAHRMTAAEVDAFAAGPMDTTPTVDPGF